VGLQPRFWYNEELESRNFLIPGSFAIIMTLIGTLLTALVVSREWERGTMEAMMSTPVSIVELVVGKLIPYYILGFFSLAICVGFSLLLYDLPLRGTFFTLALVSGIFLFSALGMGLLISTISKNQTVASQIALVVGFLPAFMLSGFIFEIASMPYWIQLLTYILPARYFVSSLLTIFLVGDVWRLIIYNAIPMIVMGLFLFIATARKTVKRLD
jgi:ABC-2 type transport system permease protein